MAKYWVMNSSYRFQWGSWQIGGPRHYYRECLIVSLIKKIIPGGRILDVGCGTGSLMVQLALKGYQVYGIDASEECVRLTAERLRVFTRDASSFIKRSGAEQIDFPDGLFDGVIAAEVLEHVEKDYLVVKEIYRLLKPGGICLITVPANPYLWDISDEMAGHKRRYNKDDLLRLFNKSSFPHFNVEDLFYLGFPVMRLYHRLVFLRWARHIEGKRDGAISTKDTMTRLGFSRWTTLILGNLFRIDNLFSFLPWGIGILLVARKI